MGKTDSDADVAKNSIKNTILIILFSKVQDNHPVYL